MALQVFALFSLDERRAYHPDLKLLRWGCIEEIRSQERSLL